MLKELSIIATDMLGLQGYPLTPIRWADFFAARTGETAKSADAHPAEPASPTAKSSVHEQQPLHRAA